MATFFFRDGGNARRHFSVAGDGSVADPHVPLVGFGDTPSLDAFGRLRVSNPVTLFDSTFQYDAQPLIFVAKTSGAATLTHLPNESSVQLGVGAASGDAYVYQSRRYLRYQPGKSQLILITAALGAPRANCVKRVGYFDASNGVFFQDIGGAAFWALRSLVTGSVVDTTVAQASWNIDKMDGIGPSGLVLDATKGQIFLIDLEWLSLGRVRVGFVIGGRIVYVHQFLHANLVGGAYMTTATLPVRYEIANVGATGGSTTLKAICASVISEGGQEIDRAVPFAASNGIAAIGVTTRRPILSIRPKATFNSIVNRGAIIPQEAFFRVATNDAFFEIVYGGVLTNASFGSVDPHSITEADVAASAIAGGIVIGSLSVPEAGGNRGSGSRVLSGRLPLTLDVDGANPIPLSVVATSYTGTSNVSAALNWNELR